MSDRTVKVTLLATAQNYVQGMSQAQQATQRLASEHDKMSRAEKIAAQDAQKTAQIRKQSMETLAKGAVVAGGAITAIGIAALKTGIQYNTLQQTSRAALTTLLGSAKDANAQMDKLDDFARTSPFAKQVFIQAQQQLLGFGMEAEKVVPTLQAIQDAVAAVGGSSQQISEITLVLSQIQAAGKITATDLMQLGQRGIDAATLIGSQMGMTGAQIRDQITAGALDAGTALDALTKGMEAKFGGAAANVKQTFSGAMDRVKAAWRDFSSELAEPLVGKNGGGALIGLLNWTADVMRAFQKLPGPVKTTATVVTGLTGAILLAGGTAILAVPKIVAFRIAVQTLKTQSPLAARAVGGLNKAISLLGKAATVLIVVGALKQLADVIVNQLKPSSEELKNALVTSGSAIDLFQKKATIVTTNGFSLNVEPMVKSAEDLHKALGLAKDETEGFFGWLKANTRFADPDMVFGKLRDGMRDLGKEMAAAPETIIPTFQKLRDEYKLSEVEMEQLIRLSPDLTAALVDQASSAKVSSDASNLVKLALGEIKPAADDATGAVDANTAATKEAADAQKKWKAAVADSDAAFIDIKSAYDNLVDQNKKVAQSTADSTSNQKDSWEDFYDGAKVSIDKWLKEIEGQVKAQENWEKNMTLLAGKVSANTLSELAKLGPDGAPLVAELVDASDSELARLDTVMGKRTDDATGKFADRLDKAQPVIAAASAQLGEKAAKKIAHELSKGTKTVDQIVKKYGLILWNQPMKVNVSTTDAGEKISRFVDAQSRKSVTVRVYASGLSTMSLPNGWTATSKAAGGFIPGSPSLKDNMLAHVASGEFVTRTAQAQKPGNRRVLEWMNAGGDFGSYAGGGFVKPQYADPYRPVATSTPVRSGPAVEIVQKGNQYFSYNPHDVVREQKEQMTRALDAAGVEVW